MTHENYKAEQAKISKEIERLKKQSLSLLNKRRKSEIISIIRNMQEYGIAPDELADVCRANHHSPNTPTILSDAMPSP